MKLRRTIPWLLLALGCACSPSTAIPTATVEPSPIHPAGTATNTAAPTASETPLPPTFAPYTLATPATALDADLPTETPSPTPLAIELPQERLHISRPGAGSNVTSPFLVQGRAGPSWNRRVRIRLLGEDGRVLADYHARLFGLPDRPSRFGIYIDFSISQLAEAGRLEISNYSPNDRMVDHMASVDLTLLSRGQPLVHFLPEQPEKLVILGPQEHDTIRGGTVRVQGAARVGSELPLVVQVLDRRGEIVGSAEVALQAPAVGQLGTFEIEVAYTIPYRQSGRIAVMEMGTSPPGVVHYTSLQVNLSP
ncbi:MAG: Gmad2 immunoglobulin-like domain-containing protein [Anaerolineales bacterium]|jgi:hypothetical protein